MEILKIPIQLCKRMGDGPTGEIRYQIEVPEKYIDKNLDRYRQYFFVLLGPFDEQSEIEEFIYKGVEDGNLP